MTHSYEKAQSEPFALSDELGSMATRKGFHDLSEPLAPQTVGTTELTRALPGHQLEHLGDTIHGEVPEYSPPDQQAV